MLAQRFRSAAAASKRISTSCSSPTAHSLSLNSTRHHHAACRAVELEHLRSRFGADSEGRSRNDSMRCQQFQQQRRLLSHSAPRRQHAQLKESPHQQQQSDADVVAHMTAGAMRRKASTPSPSSRPVAAPPSAQASRRAADLSTGPTEPQHSAPLAAREVAKAASTSASGGSPLPPDPKKGDDKQLTLRQRVSSIWKMAKQLFRFYFDGLKKIWTNRSEAKRIKRAVRDEGYVLTRADKHLLRTHTSDMAKLPLFVVILVVLEELLPFVVLYAPSLLPSTCVLPSQLDSIYASAELSKHEVVKEVAKSSDQGSTQSELAKLMAEAKGAPPTGDVLPSLSRQSLVQLAALFSLWQWGTAGMLRRRIATHLAYLRDDDALMAEGVGFNVIPRDKLGLVKACSERGLRAVGLPYDQQVDALERWVSRSVSVDDSTGSNLLFLPLQLYTDAGITDLQAQAAEVARKGIWKRTMEVMNSVVRAETQAQDQSRRLQEEVKSKEQEKH